MNEEEAAGQPSAQQAHEEAVAEWEKKVSTMPLDVQQTAISNFLTQCETEVRQRNRERALAFLEKASRRIAALPDLESRKCFEERYRSLEICAHLTQLVPKMVKPFERRTKIYTKETMDPIAYHYFHQLSQLMRMKVFVRELMIPAQIEFDERDDKALHGVVLVGDAPQTYSRFWINNGDDGVKWAVLDRICTLQTSHVERRRGSAVYMLNSLVYYLDSVAAKANLNVLVVHVPLKSSLPLVDRLLAKGFRFVLSHEEYQQRKGRMYPFYFDGDRMRLNTVHLYFPLPHIPEDRVRRDLIEIQKAERAQIAMSLDPANVARQKEVFTRARTRYIEHQKQQEQAKAQAQAQAQAQQQHQHQQ